MAGEEGSLQVRIGSVLASVHAGGVGSARIVVCVLLDVDTVVALFHSKPARQHMAWHRVA